MKKNVKKFLYKAGIVFICLFMLMNLTDLSKMEGIFAADSNIEFESTLLKSIDGTGASSIEVQSGETFFIKSSYSINSLGGGDDKIYTAGTLLVQLPEKAVFNEAMTRQLMAEYETIFTDFEYSPAVHLLTFKINGNFKSGVSGDLYMAFNYPNMTTEDGYGSASTEEFTNIAFSASVTGGGSIEPIRMGNLKVINQASQGWNIEKTIVKNGNSDYSINPDTSTYDITYNLNVKPDGLADRYGRLDCETFELVDTLPSPFASTIQDTIAQGYPAGGGAKSIRIVANEGEQSERILTENNEYTLERNSDGSISKIHFNKNAINTITGNYVPADTMSGTSFRVYASYDYNSYEIPRNEKEISKYLLDNQLQLTYKPLGKDQVEVQKNAATELGWTDDEVEPKQISIQKQIAIDTDNLTSSTYDEIRDFDATLQKAFLQDGETITFTLYKDQSCKTIAKDFDGNTIDAITLTNEGKHADGIVQFENLLPGTYYLKESMNFSGFTEPVVKKIVISKAGGITVDNDPVTDGNTIKFVNHTDESGFGYVAFWKKGTSAISAESDKPLEGVTFTLTSKKDTSKKYTATSDENGLVFFQGIPAGDYTLMEEERAGGEFEKPSNDWTVKVVGNRVNYPRNANNTELQKDNSDHPYISNKSTKGGVQIIKQDKETNATLTGAEFIAYGPYADEATADAAVIDGSYDKTTGTKITQDYTDGTKYFALTSGYYVFKEVKAPKGYVLSAATTVSEVKQNILTKLEIKNEKMITVTVKKTGQLAESGMKVPLAGAKFTIYTDEDCTNPATDLTNAEYPKDAVIETSIEAGQPKSTAVQLPKGEYWIKETTTPDGYQKDSNAYKLDLTNLGTNEYVYDKVNTADTLGQIKITKVSAANHDTKIKNVSFEIWQGNEFIETVKTNDQGIATSKFLPSGKYTVKETSQPNGYSSNSKGRVFKAVGNNGVAIESGEGIAVIKNTVTEMTVENEPLVTFKIKKTESDGTTPIEKVQFALYASKKDADENKAIARYTTNDQGEITFVNLEPNTTYWYKETKTAGPEYILNGEILSFISPGKENNYQQESNLPVIKNTKYGQLKVIKKLLDFNSGDSATRTLSGIKFSCYPKQSEDSVKDKATAKNLKNLYEGTTDENGEFVFENLEPGDYWLVEELTESQKEQYTAVDPQTVTVTEGISATYEVKNKTSYGRLHIKKVGGLSEDGKTVPVIGAHFNIYAYIDDNANSYTDKTVIKDITVTQNDGTVSVDLPAGKYAVIETLPNLSGASTNIDKYTPDTTKVHEVTIANNTDNEVLTNAPVKNVPKGRFYIEKQEVWGDSTSFPQSMVFGIYKNQSCELKDLVGTVQTDATGKAISPYLDAGTYWVKESLSPAQIKVYGEPEAKEVTVIAGQNHEDAFDVTASTPDGSESNPLKFENHPRKSKIQITKVDQKDNSILLNDAEFELYKVISETTGIQPTVINGSSVYLQKVNETTYKTGTADVDGDGKADKGQAYTVYLDPGTYYLKEMKAPENYQMVTQWTGPIEITDTPEIKHQTVENYIPQTATGTKVNHKNEVIKKAGILVALLTDETKANDLVAKLNINEKDVQAELENKENYAKYGVLQIATTTAEGTFSFKELNESQTYYIVEVKTLDAYVRDATVHTVTVKGLSDGNYQLQEDNKEFMLQNTEKGRIQVKKEIELSGHKYPLNDVDFTIGWAKTQMKDKNYEIEGAVQTYTTGTFTEGVDGTFLSGSLKPGWYVLREVKTPEGIADPDNSKVWKVEVKAGEINQEYFTNGIENVVNYGKFYLKKVDAASETIEVSAHFRLEILNKVTNEYETKIEDIAFTANKGNYESPLLPSGSYRLIETSVQDNYTLLKEPVEFKIEKGKVSGTDGEGNIVPLAADDSPIIIKNEKQGSLKIKKTGTLVNDADAEPLSGITFSLYRASSENKDQAERDMVEGNLVKTYTTKNDGIITMNHLDAGSYWLKETGVSITNKDMGYVEGKFELVKIEAGIETTNLPNSKDFTNESTYGVIKITKQDYKTKDPLQSAVFEVYNNATCTGTSVNTITTGDGGIGYSDMLPAGEYYLKEKTAPNGYFKSDTIYGPYTVVAHKVVTGSTDKAPEIITNKAKQSIRIKKLDSNTNAEVDAKYMNTASFALYASQENAEAENNALQTISKGSSTFVFHDLQPETTYYVKELSAPNGYTASDEIKEVTTGTGLGDASIVEVPINNAPKGSILLKKVAQWDLSGDTNQVLPLKGAGFVLKKLENGNDSAVDSTFTPVTVESDANGMVEFLNLDAGKYQITEKEYAGFEKNTQIYTVTVNAGEQNAEYAQEDKQIINNPTLGKFTFTKTAPDGSVIANVKDAKFQLQHQKTDNTWETVATYENFSVQKDNGEFESGMLEPGKYKLSETTAPKNFAKMQDIEFTITAKQIINVNSLEAATVVNEALGNVSITKISDSYQYDEAHVKKPLVATFELVNEDKNYHNFQTTNEKNGKITWENLEPGTYTLKETITPQGYKKMEDKTVEVAAGQSKVLTYYPKDSTNGEIVNQSEKGVLVIHKVDEKGKGLAGAEFEFYKKGEQSSVGRVSTDDNGYAISGLLDAQPSGTTYTVKEVKAPDSYTLDSTYHPIEQDINVVPLQSADIIKTNYVANNKTTNYAEFVNKPDNFYQDFKISINKTIGLDKNNLSAEDISEQNTKALIGNDQNMVFGIREYAEGKNEIDAKQVTVTDETIKLYYLDNGKYKEENLLSDDYTINKVTVYPAYAGSDKNTSDPVDAKLEYQTFGSTEWKEYPGSAQKLENLNEASSDGVTVDTSTIADKPVHIRIVYTKGTKANFHAEGIDFEVTFLNRVAKASATTHEIRKASNQASVIYQYAVKNNEGIVEHKEDEKQSNVVNVYFPLQNTVAPKAGISIKTDNGTSFAPQDTVYYTITVENKSGGTNPPDLELPIISFDLPQGTSLVNDYKNIGRNFLVLYGEENDAVIIEPEDLEVVISDNVPAKEINKDGELIDTAQSTKKVTVKLKNLDVSTSKKLFLKFAVQVSANSPTTGLMAPCYLTSGASVPKSVENPYGNSVVFDVSSGSDVVEDKTLDQVVIDQNLKEDTDIGGEKYAFSSVNVTVKATNNLVVYKEVKGQYDKQYLSSANIASTAPNGTIDYNIILQNGSSDEKVETSRLVDILPFYGDTMVSRTNANQTVTERGTELQKRPILTSVTALDMNDKPLSQPYTIWYCVSSGVTDEELTSEWTKAEREKKPRDLELPMLYNSWNGNVWEGGAHTWQKEVPDDLSKVTAVGIEVDHSQKALSAYEGYKLHIEMKAPNYSTDQLSDVLGKLIKNSAMGAVRRLNKNDTINLSDTVENDPVQVQLSLAKGSIGDYAFFDRNKEGKQDSEAIPVTGLDVYLHTYRIFKNNKGDIVKEELPVKNTTTNELGYYLFDNLDCNNMKDADGSKDDPDNYVGGSIYSYRVEFATPQDESMYKYVPTIREAGDDRAKDSNIERVKVGDKEVNLTEEIWLSTIIGNDGSIKGEDNMTIDAGFKALSALGDTVWIDKNRNGLQDTDEPGIANVMVRLYKVDKDGNTGKVFKETLTGYDGKYLFDGLEEGKYVVEFDITGLDSYGYAPYSFTIPYVLGDPLSEEDSNAREYKNSKTISRSDVINLKDHSVDLSIDAGLTYYSALSGYCFEDRNYNNIQDLGIALPHTVVELYRIDESGKRTSAPIQKTTVGNDGKYFFDKLIEGYYQVKFIFPDGFEAVEPHQGNDEMDSDVSEELDTERQSGYTPVFYIAPNSLEKHWDAGAVRYGSIGDYVWQDLNKNGIQDAGEPPIAGVPVYLQTRQKGESTWNFYAASETNEHGRYVFEKLKGSEYTEIEYRVIFDLPYDTKLTTPIAGDDINVDSNALANYINGWGFPTNVIRLGYGQNDMTWDAGIIQTSGSIGDYVWFDQNKNGIQDEENTGISGIRVVLERNDSDSLEDNAWTYIAETKTNKAGYYRFDDLQPGYYRVKFYLKGYTVTLPLEGNDSAVDSDGYEKKGNWYITRPFYLDEGGFDMTWDCGVYGIDSFDKPNISQTINGPITADKTNHTSSLYYLGISFIAMLVLGKRLRTLGKETL